MPSEVFDVDKFVEISGRADSCAVKRLKGIVKLKVRTGSRLYTLKVDPAKAQEVISRLQCEVREIWLVNKSFDLMPSNLDSQLTRCRRPISA
jgi:ferritin-like protein